MRKCINQILDRVRIHRFLEEKKIKKNGSDLSVLPAGAAQEQPWVSAVHQYALRVSTPQPCNPRNHITARGCRNEFLSRIKKATLSNIKLPGEYHLFESTYFLGRRLTLEKSTIQQFFIQFCLKNKRLPTTNPCIRWEKYSLVCRR